MIQFGRGQIQVPDYKAAALLILRFSWPGNGPHRQAQGASMRKRMREKRIICIIGLAIISLLRPVNELNG